MLKLFFSNYKLQNPQITAAVHCFQKQAPKCSVKEGVLKKFPNFIGKHLCWSPFLIKLQAFGQQLQHRHFPVKFANFLRTTISKNICERLLPYFHHDSHHHYHHHFHYHCKMRIYHQRILLPISLDCKMIACLFQLNFIFFHLAYIFL